MKHQAADALSQLSMTGMNKSPLADVVLVLKLTKLQLEEENTGTDVNIWHSLPGNDGLDTVKPALSDALQVSVGTSKEIPLTTSDFATEQSNDP